MEEPIISLTSTLAVMARSAPAAQSMMCSGRTPRVTAPDWALFASRAACLSSLGLKHGAAGGDGVLVAGAGEHGVEEVHLRRADEAGDEEVGRVVEDLLRRADLLHEAVLHDDDAVAEGHGLGLVVRDVDEGGVDPLAELDYLGAHLVAQLGVQVGEGLVHEEDLRLADDGAADGDALPLAAGQGLGLAVQVLGDVEDLGGLADLLVYGVLVIYGAA